MEFRKQNLFHRVVITILLCSLLLTPGLSFAGWGFKLGPIKVTHNKSNPTDVGKKATKVVKKTVKVAKDAAKVVTKTVKAEVNVVEAVVKVVEGDKKGAKKAMNRAEQNAHDSVKHLGDAGEPIVKATYDVTLGAQILLTTTVLDKTLGSHLTDSYKKRRGKVSKEMRKASGKIGDVLEVAVQPENLGKIAFIYVATSFGGPMGAALANVMYDKFVLKKNMSEKDMLKSFAIGAAAGYAAEGVQGIEALKHASYMSKAASSVTRNLVTDAGNVSLNGDSYSSQDFFVSLATGLSSIEAGDGAANAIVESTIEGGLKNVAQQSALNDMNLGKIDFDQVETAIYQGFADGLTEESVHAMMDASIMKAVPEDWKRADLKAFKKMSKGFSSFIGSLYMQEAEKLDKRYENLPEDKKQEIAETANEIGKEIADKAAQKVYAKNFDELNPEELVNEKFSEEYNSQLLQASGEIAGDQRYLNIKEHLLVDTSEAPGVNRTPQIAVTGALMGGMMIYGAYSTVTDAHALYKKYQESDNAGKSFNQFYNENKGDIAWLGADVLLAATPLIAKVVKAGVMSSKIAVRVVSAARKLGLKVRDRIADFTDSIRRFTGNNVGAVGNIDEIAEASSIISRKADYILGKATGSTHNIERSKSMLRQMERIGLPDTSQTRGIVKDHLVKTLKAPSSIKKSNLEGGRVLRESLLSGKNGHLKVESIWDGNKLITVKLKGGR